MTYKELYFAATTWTAGHVAQDFMENYGRNNQVDQHDIDQINFWQAKEGGKLIPPVIQASAPQKTRDRDDLYDKESHAMHERARNAARDAGRSFSHLYWEWNRTFTNWVSTGHVAATTLVDPPSPWFC